MVGINKIKITVIIFLWALLFIPVYPEMVRDWLSHSDNSHGFLVPVIAGYFVWSRKEQLKSVVIGSSWWGGMLLFFSLAVHLLSYAGGIAFISRVALVTSLLGLVWFCMGNEFVDALVFPILFLLFMIPIPYSLMNHVALPLQTMATQLSAKIIGMCSIPFLREGNMLYFVGSQLEVAEACSGIRSLMALSMIACALSVMMNVNWKKKAALITSSIPIALLANVLRIAGTGILAHYFGDKVARGFLHEFSGIMVFIIGLASLLGVSTLMTRMKIADVK